MNVNQSPKYKSQKYRFDGKLKNMAHTFRVPLSLYSDVITLILAFCQSLAANCQTELDLSKYSFQCCNFTVNDCRLYASGLLY